MVRKHAAAFALLMFASAPGLAFEPPSPAASTIVYIHISIPLDAQPSAKAREPAVGLRLQGKREHQVVDIDSRMLDLLPLPGLRAPPLRPQATPVFPAASTPRSLPR